ncbi:hypothetical protein P691DRAFT_792364 [Macrolepiota fuliginosa MF-IS2]|uniref:Uncharacterized protein n=1 Tax=Macrolepiota fuliginosa MF-IS2 TaxID=1400762 RepID=A0A9P5WYZ0_9AGAR|nr:hypothetical protein P691DRAFT_792364 [Macrolepiota fuliginosa MF-IS2]
MGLVSVRHDMCPNSHVAYTGPFSGLDKCPTCSQSHYLLESGKSRQQFHMIPLGPQLQALCPTCELPVYEDIYYGYAYLKAVQEGSIASNDMVVMLSIDGAQLYESKQSDCWIYIWIILNLSPKIRYCQDHVLIGGIIPGPHKPENLDSFIYPGLYHLMALNNEPGKLQIWDANENLTYMLTSSNAKQYAEWCLHTGIARPNLFLAYPRDHILEVPGCFAGDIMHVCALNIPPFFLSLWRGSPSLCDSNDDLMTWDWATLKDSNEWKNHGKQVIDVTPFLPQSFDCPPCNPAEKLNSSYKAQEFLTYFYGLGPALFYDKLLMKYWKNYCKLVCGVQLIHQKAISLEDLKEAHWLLVEFVDEFEHLYYQCKAYWIHFSCQCIHALLHVCPEVYCIGPGACYAQWTMERTIGRLIHSQVNALYAIYPELKPPNATSHDSLTMDLDIGGGFFLLHASDNSPFEHGGAEATTLQTYLEGLYQCSVRGQWSPCVPNLTTPLMVALISKLTPKYDQLCVLSQNTLILATYEGQVTLTIIPVSSIKAVIAAPPAPDHLNPEKIPNLHYIVDRIGFDVSHWGCEDVDVEAKI